MNTVTVKTYRDIPSIPRDQLHLYASHSNHIVRFIIAKLCPAQDLPLLLPETNPEVAKVIEERLNQTTRSKPH